MKNVLFIASLDQAYYFDPFVQACKGKNITIFVFDPSSFPKESTICLTMDSLGKVSGFVDVLKYEVGRTKKVRLSISDINVAWHLRIGTSTNPSKRKTSLENRFIENESIASLNSFYSTLECIWINRKETIDFISSNKFFQQQVALRSGLMVPDTMISNNPESIQTMSRLKKGLLLKSMGYIRLDKEGKCSLYTELFSNEEISENTMAIRGCPIFSQAYIKKCYEYRVMAIGNRILSCRIDSQASKKTKIDWRHYDFENVEHIQTTLPKQVEKNILTFMKSIGLRYGAIDLIETPNGDFVFLEVNPAGQWGWIHDFAKLPIPETVAEMLESL